MDETTTKSLSSNNFLSSIDIKSTSCSKKDKVQFTNKKHNSRIAAIQALVQWLFFYEVKDMSEIESEIYDFYTKKNSTGSTLNYRLFSDIITHATINHKKIVKDIISPHLSDIKFDNLSPVIQCILLIAVSEFSINQTISPKIIISEYNQICSLFEPNQRVKLVHAILDNILYSLSSSSSNQLNSSANNSTNLSSSSSTSADLDNSLV